VRHHHRASSARIAAPTCTSYGKAGTGKSTLIANLATQDMAHGEGLALLDPHGDLIKELVQLVPEERKSDLMHFDAIDPASALAFNPLEVTQLATKGIDAVAMLSLKRPIDQPLSSIQGDRSCNSIPVCHARPDNTGCSIFCLPGAGSCKPDVRTSWSLAWFHLLRSRFQHIVPQVKIEACVSARRLQISRYVRQE
jgi:hypothetical protein